MIKKSHNSLNSCKIFLFSQFDREQLSYIKYPDHPRFGKLQGLAKMSLCNMAFEAHKLKKPLPGISDKDFATQERHCRII